MDQEHALYGLDDAELLTHPSAYNPSLFAGKSVLVSGGGTGIGRAIAVLYARLGAQVTICGRREEPLQETAALIREGLGLDIATHAMTIRDPQQVESLIDRI